VRRLVRAAVVAYSIRNRRRKAARVLEHMRRYGLKTIVVVGIEGDGGDANADRIESVLAQERDLLAAVNVATVTTQLRLIVGDGRLLPLASRACDLILSNAVIEHVGDEDQQRAFVAEHCRVGRSFVMTTPNRYFPIESHTSVLLRHWSNRWSADRTEFTRLLSRRQFVALLPPGTRVVGHWWSPTFTALAQ
jgi:hypothetical protein